MTDAELLAELLDLFDSRDEAEHVVQCPWCDGTDDSRCPENPVSRREAAGQQQRAEWARVVWFLRGCPPMTLDEWARELARG